MKSLLCWEKGEETPYYQHFKWEEPPYSRTAPACLATFSPLTCWKCGQTVHMMCDFRQRPSRSENVSVPRRSVALRAVTVSALRMVPTKHPAPLQRGYLNLKIGIFPALVDTGDQFSRVSSDFIDYLCHRGVRCTFFLYLLMFVNWRLYGPV